MRYSVTVKYRCEHGEFEFSNLKEEIIRHAGCVGTAKIQAVKRIVEAYPVISVDVIDAKVVE